MAEDNKVDLVAQLPDEVWVKIIGHLPSLRDKLRLESVNKRFQRCLIALLRTRPIPFTFTYDSISKEHLNGCCLLEPFPEVLRSLGKKAKFNSIDIDVCFAANLREFDSVLAALVSSDIDCLDKVTTVKVISYCGCNETLLKDLFAKCTKLSEVRLDFEVSGPFPLNLGVVLKDKALTRLSANFYSATRDQELLIQMFKSIKPNTLRGLDLHLNQIALNMDVLVTELCGGGWSALEQIDINWCVYNMAVDTLFSSLTRLPKLRKCHFVLEDGRQDVQLVPDLTSLAAGLKFLFANHAEITVDYDVNLFYTQPTGCQLVALIRQVQSVHPELEVGFGHYAHILTLTLGEVSFKQEIDRSEPCNNAECPECRIFYPAVIFRIASEANGLQNVMQQHEMRLANARLDRCRMDSVARHLNGSGWLLKALEAKMNEARDLATITFELPWPPHDQYQITVDCGHCLNNSCFGCLYVG